MLKSKLLVLCILAWTINGWAQTSELFFSEYIEGSSNNKAVEIFNGTGAAIDLAAGNYDVQMFFNGGTTAGLTINLTGTVADGDVYVLAHSGSDSVILAQADLTNGAGWFNGDDAVVLRKNGIIIDVIGQIGFDPGTEWGSGLTSTADNTLRRKSSICGGDTTSVNTFDPSLEWDGFATDTFDGLGAHTANCTLPCAITDLAAGAQTPCVPATNQYTQQVVVAYSNPPASGTLEVNGQSFAITSSPQTVTLTGLIADGAPVDVTASFSAEPGCTLTENDLFTAPANCVPPPCAITDLAAGAQTPCVPATNQYTQQVVVAYSNPPASGTLEVNDQSFAITSSPQTVTLTGLIADGAPVDVTASFSAEPGCTLTENDLFTAPGSCTPPPAISPNLVLLADRDITISRHAGSQGDIHSNGDIKFNKGNPSTHEGNVMAVGKIIIQAKNTIDGDVTAGAAVSNAGMVTGAITQNAAVPTAPLPNLSFSAGGDNVTAPKNGLLALAPGSYGNVQIQKNGRLELSDGDYFLESLNLDKSAVLAFDVSAGSATVNVKGAIDFGKNSEVEISPGGEHAADEVTVNSLSAGSLKIHAGAKVLGSIMAPKATVVLDKNARFKGAIFAKAISVNKDATFLHHSSSTSLPKAAPLEDEAAEETTVSAPAQFELGQNYPNPFNPSTTITFAVPRVSEVTLSIYNLRGQLVRTVVTGVFAAGRHQAVWDGTDSGGVKVASGVYLYRLEAKDFVAVKKLLLAK